MATIWNPLAFGGQGAAAPAPGSGTQGQPSNQYTTPWQYGAGGGPPQSLSQGQSTQQYQLGQQQLAQQATEFNDVYGTLSGLLGQGSSTGQNTPAPTISAAPIWSPQQIQQQVNNASAQALQGAQSSNQALAAKMAGQGFGSTSPALTSQQSNAMMQALASAQNQGNAIRWNAAQGNAQQVLAGQTAQSTQWQQANALNVQRAQIAEQLQAAGMGALAGLI